MPVSHAMESVWVFIYYVGGVFSGKYCKSCVFFPFPTVLCPFLLYSPHPWTGIRPKARWYTPWCNYDGVICQLGANNNANAYHFWSLSNLTCVCLFQSHCCAVYRSCARNGIIVGGLERNATTLWVLKMCSYDKWRYRDMSSNFKLRVPLVLLIII